MSEPNYPQWPADRQPWPGQPQPEPYQQQAYGNDQARYQVRPEEQAYALAPYQQQPVAQPWGRPQHYQAVAARSAGVAVLCSFFLPGLGSMINNKVGKGILILACYLVSVALCFFLVGIILAPACWIWGMVAGANDANRWNRANGLIS